MTEPPVRLTARQIAVAEGLARHQTLKQIAAELDISTSAVAKHIAGLKQALGATSRAGIVATLYPESAPRLLSAGVQKDSWPNFHLPPAASAAPQRGSDDPGLLGFGDGSDYPALAGRVAALEWPGLNEPRIVPRWLDGPNALPARLMVVIGGVFAIMGALAMSISILRGVSELSGESGLDLELEKQSAM